MLAGLDLVPIGKPAMKWATQVGSTSIRCLGTIQLATALVVRGDFDSVVAYDRPLLETL